jgi:hypothetical protein
MDLLTAFLAGTLATFVPLYLGIFAPQILQWLGRVLRLFDLDLNSQKTHLYLAAIAAGILVWFLVDVLGDAALLDVNIGFTGGYAHLVLAGMFGVGLGLLFGVEKFLAHRPEVDDDMSLHTDPPSMMRQLGYGAAIAAAAGIGFHAFGEGLGIGADIPSSSSILYAIGGISAGTAYVLHKLLEGLVIGVFALLARSATGRRQGMLGLLSGVPTILGFLVGVSIAVDSTYFFALGGAGGIYAELRLVPIFSGREVKYGLIIAFLLGIYAMYLAGLFHAIQG